MNKEKLIEDISPLLEELESIEQTTYVPTEEGKVVGKSGVTIGKGIDLGSRDADDLLDLGFTQESVDKLSNFLGKKGAEAAKALEEFGTVTITDEELEVTTDRIVDQEIDKFITNFEDNVGYPVSELPEQVLQGLALQSFQLGNSMYENDNGTSTRFLGELKRKDFAAAAKNMGSWNNSAIRGLRKRYGFAGEVMAGKTSIEDVGRLSSILRDIKAGEYDNVKVDEYKLIPPVEEEVTPIEEAPEAFSMDSGLEYADPFVDTTQEEEEYIPTGRLSPSQRRARIGERIRRRKERERQRMEEDDLSRRAGEELDRMNGIGGETVLGDGLFAGARAAQNIDVQPYRPSVRRLFKGMFRR